MGQIPSQYETIKAYYAQCAHRQQADNTRCFLIRWHRLVRANQMKTVQERARQEQQYWAAQCWRKKHARRQRNKKRFQVEKGYDDRCMPQDFEINGKSASINVFSRIGNI